jgi:hypothetical protein
MEWFGGFKSEIDALGPQAAAHQAAKLHGHGLLLAKDISGAYKAYSSAVGVEDFLERRDAIRAWYKKKMPGHAHYEHYYEQTPNYQQTPEEIMQGLPPEKGGIRLYIDVDGTWERNCVHARCQKNREKGSTDTCDMVDDNEAVAVMDRLLELAMARNYPLVKRGEWWMRWMTSSNATKLSLHGVMGGRWVFANNQEQMKEFMFRLVHMAYASPAEDEEMNRLWLKISSTKLENWRQIPGTVVDLKVYSTYRCFRTLDSTKKPSDDDWCPQQKRFVPEPRKMVPMPQFADCPPSEFFLTVDANAVGEGEHQLRQLPPLVTERTQMGILHDDMDVGDMMGTLGGVGKRGVKRKLTRILPAEVGEGPRMRNPFTYHVGGSKYAAAGWEMQLPGNVGKRYLCDERESFLGSIGTAEAKQRLTLLVRSVQAKANIGQEGKSEVNFRGHPEKVLRLVRHQQETTPCGFGEYHKSNGAYISINSNGLVTYGCHGTKCYGKALRVGPL